MSAGAACIAASLLFGVPAAFAQAITPDSCGVPVRMDTVTDTVYAWILPPARGEPLAEHDFRAEQIRAAVGGLDPTLLDLGAWRRVPNEPLPASAPDFPPGVRMLIWFQIRNDGRLVGMRLERSSGWALLDTSAQRGILRADSLHALHPLPPALREQGVDLWLAAGIGRAPGATSIPLARYRHLEIHYDAAQRLPRLLGIAYRPLLPDSTIRAGIGHRLAFDFVIDTTGFVDPASIVPLSTEFEAFADEAKRTVRASRFAPSMVGRCKVQRRVQLPFDFFLRH